MIELNYDTGEIWEPLYQIGLQADPIEIELFQSKEVRRLKHIHHFGAGSLLGPITHSRYEHTMGVWAIAKMFFPDQLELRIAAILHDIGHLPFSHAVERTLGLDHHDFTVELIQSTPISKSLKKHGVNSNAILDLLHQDSPLTSKTNYLGIDHFDSFLRDTYMVGKFRTLPFELINRISFQGCFVETDAETAKQIIEAIVEDHNIICNPTYLAMDALLAAFVQKSLDAAGQSYGSIRNLTDDELLGLLKNSPCAFTKKWLDVLLLEPHKIHLCKESDPYDFQATVKKVYKKQPLVNGLPVTQSDLHLKSRLDQIDKLCGNYYFQLRQSEK